MKSRNFICNPSLTLLGGNSPFSQQGKGRGWGYKDYVPSFAGAFIGYIFFALYLLEEKTCKTKLLWKSYI